MRKIIHIDADAFYASVEERDDPKLKALPIAVGGSPSGRGVVATCNYIARQFGVRSAMPSAHALKLCPDIVFIKPRFTAYREASKQMHEIFRRYTDQIEPLSLDEAYLDVSLSDQHQGSATRIAEEIQKAISNELNLSVSAGVAPNKFLAKIASDWKKPAGLFVITPSEVDAFVSNLPVGKINGVGKVTEQKLNKLGIKTCADIRNAPQGLLEERFGKYGGRLSELALGIDEREVKTERLRKSLSIENTLSNDVNNIVDIKKLAGEFYKELLVRGRKLKPEQKVAARYVKLKFNDFSQTTLEESLHIGIEDWRDLTAFETMLEKAWQRKSMPVRLIGLGLRISNTQNDEHQLDLFANSIEPKAD